MPSSDTTPARAAPHPGQLDPGPGDGRPPGAVPRPRRKAARPRSGLPKRAAPRVPRPPRRPAAAPSLNGHAGDGQADDQATSEHVLTLAEVRREPVRWLLPSLVPFGFLTLLDGKKGAGKSSVAAALAAAVTAGLAVPGRKPQAPVACIWLSGEEDPGTILLPKLLAAGARPGSVHIPGTGARGAYVEPWTLPTCLPRLARLAESTGARLIVLDPVSSAVAAGVDLRQPQEARRIMQDLARLAAGTGAAVLGSRNCRKGSGGDLIDQGLGSAEVGNVARSVLRVDVTDPASGQRVLRAIASNLCHDTKALQYVLAGEEGFPCVVWGKWVNADGVQILDKEEDPTERDALADAEQFLKDVLADGRMSTKELARQADDAQISRGTLRRAKQRLGIQSIAEGARESRVSYWQLGKT